MKCPVDSATLQITNRDGIEVDYCPDCRGVWLDRGELDKIIERSGGYSKPSPSVRHYDDDEYDYGRGNHQSYDHHKKKKKNFLEDIFDF